MSKRCVIVNEKNQVAKVCDSVDEAIAWVEAQQGPDRYTIIRPHEGHLEITYKEE